MSRTASSRPPRREGFLLTKESYTDFELRADVWATPDSNGGVLFRITKPDDPGIENGYELNINDKRADQTGRTGSIVNVAKPLVQFDAGGKWVTVDITAKGPHMVATLNGIKTAEADDAKYNERAGVIAGRRRHRALSQRPDQGRSSNGRCADSHASWRSSRARRSSRRSARREDAEI